MFDSIYQDTKAKESLEKVSKMIFDMNHTFKYPGLHNRLVDDDGEIKEDTDMAKWVSEWYEELNQTVLDLAKTNPIRDTQMRNAIFIYSSACAKLAAYFTSIGNTTDIEDRATALKIVQFFENIRFFAEYDANEALDLKECCERFRRLKNDCQAFESPLSSGFDPKDFLYNVTSDEFIRQTIEVMSMYV